ncbi:protease complex subunit PrcB family protein [Natroniella sulfidigena]|uniref:protease complex subunit PrcB family protein n=1 Tax=Natroniella sulfidigena TaxID=723921 RepID=UPI00200AF0CD|nr:protease complex subunit PrcB family protein [Natroniella sulfidigena]MCK8817130.1 protease complex subunit PrcB family protein [Natroniella sulfidigena]
MGLIGRKEIPFTPLLEKEVNGRWQKDDYDCNLIVKILTKPDNNLELPKYHQKVPERLNIDYDKYYLIYVSLGEYNACRYDIKIDKIIKRKDKVIIKVKTVSCTPECIGLELISLPYDLVKVPKKHLIKDEEELKFKFIDQENNLLTSKSLKLS